VYLRPTGAVAVAKGPFRIFSEREVCWQVRPREAGYQRLVLEVGGRAVDKEVAVGDGFLRVNTERPEWSWSDALLHPGEEPLRPDSQVQSIRIDYPERASWTSGTDSWWKFWFVGSMVAALCFRRLLNVSV
jgi:hypothetical protein